MNKLNRRELFSVLPAGAAGCLGCIGGSACAAQAETHTWTEKADMTWEGLFRFAYQKDFIPLLKGIGEGIGKDKLLNMLKEITSGAATRGMASKTNINRDFAAWVANLKQMPPMIQHTLAVDIVEDSPRAFEYRVSRCLWAKTFREAGAADIGYAAVCHPDFAVASGFNPKLKLIRTKTLMEGHDCCNHRYVIEA